jgi:transcriptional regulator with XRE-family HTH domain
MAKRPVSLNPKQKLIAELLAVGMSSAQAAKEAGVSRSYVEILQRGSLFELEIDAARERLMRKKLKKFASMIVDELEPSLEKIRTLRDTADDERVQLRAAESIIEKALPRGGVLREGETETRVHVTLSDEKAAIAREVIAEAISGGTPKALPDAGNPETEE